MGANRFFKMGGLKLDSCAAGFVLSTPSSYQSPPPPNF